MHKYVTRQRLLFAHRVQELSGAETSLKMRKYGRATVWWRIAPDRSVTQELWGGLQLLYVRNSLRRKNRKASHDRAHSERRAA
ncbi:hypothetical protein HNR55_000223 [Acetobacter lovaniensis]|uniref:Uncharacterized protein n=1 Tax=Acetobacter lovaniensis TaxID=104100 RepID=A0A841QBV3_9PROT|nr:hypothetical protein [Acetobacter lovaniensis]